MYYKIDDDSSIEAFYDEGESHKVKDKQNGDGLRKLSDVSIFRSSS